MVLSLFAGRETPSASSLNFLKGIALSVPIARVVGLGLLPGWDGFPLLCVGLGGPLFCVSLCMSRPRMASVASAFCIFATSPAWRLSSRGNERAKKTATRRLRRVAV